MIFLSEALIREPVGIAETEAGDWLVRFAEIDLGIIDRRSKKLRRFTAARPRLGTDGRGGTIGVTALNGCFSSDARAMYGSPE
jgi:hypothetical protein